MNLGFFHYKNFIFTFLICFSILGFTSCEEDSSDLEFRSIDGSGNNQSSLEMNAILTALGRIVSSDYGDGVSTLSGDTRLSAREVSNGVSAQEAPIPNTFGNSDYLWQWGQFLDHDIDLTPGVDPAEPADIPVPTGDIFFDPFATGTVEITFNRSIFDTTTGTDTTNPRQQINEITGWIDASNVYGSDEERASALRTNDGTGMLRTSAGNLLPFNADLGLPNDNGPNPGDPLLFAAGDIRANEQVGLTAMHTLFVREHNRLAAEIAEDNPDYDGDRIYEEARKIVGAQMQVITYHEFLPALLGEGAISDYDGYDPDVDSTIMNIFSTAAYRFGHSALSPTLLRLDDEGEVIADGNLSLSEAFFTPATIINEGGIDPILRGLAKQLHQKIDLLLVDEVRNFLFGPPGAGGFDLAALNIQRGRDHGLPSLNDVRDQLGLIPYTSFDQINSDPDAQISLAATFTSVNDIDLWTGGLAEEPFEDSHLGEAFFTILKLQFEALRDGDRFWYEIYLDDDQIDEVESTTLTDIIRRNTSISSELQDNVFFVE